MRFRISVAALALLPASTAFLQPHSVWSSTSTKRFVSGDSWDNDSFLDSLSGGQQQQESANEEYYGSSRFGRPQPPPGGNEQESIPSAQQFAREAGDGYSRQYAQQFKPSQHQYSPPPTQGGQTFTNPPPMGQPQPPQSNDDISQQLQQLQQQIQQLQQQQEMQQQQQQQYQQYAPPPSSPSPSGQAAAQDAFSRQLALQQQMQQQQSPPSQQPPVPPPTDGPTSSQTPPTQTQQSISPEDSQRNQDDIPDESIEGAELTPEMRAKAKASHTPDEEASQGGQLFRSMMARAKQRAAQQERMAMAMPPPPSTPPPPSNVQIPANAMDLSVEEQARLFREIMASRQQQQQLGSSTAPALSAVPPEAQPGQASASYAQMQLPSYPYGENSPKPQYLPDGIGYDGRKIGRNKDAEMISNNADVYLAQLKRDSSTRRIARDKGDMDKANAVFHDPSIQEITAPVNPYLEEQRAKERDMLDTVPEEMLLFQEYNKNKSRNTKKGYSGINFRERLAQQKAKKKGGDGGNASNGSQEQ